MTTTSLRKTTHARWRTHTRTLPKYFLKFHTSSLHIDKSIPRATNDSSMLGGTSTAVPKREPCMAVQRRILHSGGWHHISTFRLLCGSGRGDVGCGRRYPSKHTSHHTVFARTNDQVPVIWHEAKREQFDRILFESLTDNAQKCFVVFFFMKNWRESKGSGLFVGV